jgi:hypothetical protein
MPLPRRSRLQYTIEKEDEDTLFCRGGPALDRRAKRFTSLSAGRQFDG